MSLIQATDTDFRLCQLSFATLLDIQLEAEQLGLATRWSSACALQARIAFHEERICELHAAATSPLQLIRQSVEAVELDVRLQADHRLVAASVRTVDKLSRPV